jgi:hypothetical protein
MLILAYFLISIVMFILLLESENIKKPYPLSQREVLFCLNSALLWWLTGVYMMYEKRHIILESLETLVEIDRIKGKLANGID